MHDHVPEIEHYPACFRRAFDTWIARAGRDKIFVERLEYRTNLALIVRCTDNEIIGYCRRVAKIKQDNLMGLLVLSDGNRAAGQSYCVDVTTS